MMLEKISQLATRANTYKDRLTNEEITKTSLVLPFVSILGYDVTNPVEVVPEFDADFADLKSDKVDLCIKINDQPTVMIECKKFGTAFDKKHKSQLAKYFHFIPSIKIAILTNGHDYEIYSDLIDTNKMDETPFLKFNIDKINEQELEILKLIHKDNFNLQNIINIAIKTNVTSIIAKQIKNNFSQPSDDYLTFILKQVIDNLPGQPSIINQKLKDQYRQNVIDAHQRLVNDEIATRLQIVMSPQTKEVKLSNEESNIASEPENKVITTEDEIFGYNIVKAILCQVIDLDRITMRDAQSYCAILFDDNNRKPIVRLLFNSKSAKYIEIFENKDAPIKIQIEKINSIYSHADSIKKAIEQYL